MVSSLITSCLNLPTVILLKLKILKVKKSFVYGDIISKHNNQSLKNLVSVGTDNTSSIIANTIPVLSWYSHGAVLTVLYPSGIITFLILAIFRKTLFLSLI